MADRGRCGKRLAPRETGDPPGLRAPDQEAEAPRSQTPRACGAVQRAAQSEARASPRQPCGSRKEARLREGPALLSSAGVLLLGEGRGAKEPAERQKRGEGKPGGLRQPPEEKQEEKEPAQAGAVTEVRALAAAGPGDLPCALPPVEHLRALQLDRQPVALHASKAFARLRKRQRPRSKVHLERRSLLIKGIPGFWATAMAQHPEMAAGISEEDKDMLSYMITLEVEEEDQPSNCCTISLFFRNDPYFHNGLLVKEFFLWHTTGYRASRSTPIQWRTAYKDRAYSHSQYHRSPNFFGWFTDHSSAGCERMTQIILEDLWINPLPCYLKSKKPPEEGAGPPEMLWSLGVNPAQDVHLPGWSVEAEHRVESAGCGKSGDL